MTALLANAQQVDRAISQAIVVMGAAVLAVWLLKTSLGRTALAGSKPRRHQMPIVTPIAAVGIWFIAGPLVQDIMVSLAGRAHGSQASVRDSVAYSIGSIPFIAFILLVGHFFFARGIKGLGLRLRTIPKSFGRAVLCLLAVLPVVMAVLAIIEYIGRLAQGQTYQIPVHEKLQELSKFPTPAVRTLLILAAVVVAPIQEEMLFRGIFQTFIRSYIGMPWVAIAVTAAMFAGVHADSAHWPALFVLAMGMGYSYEKSGSLWQPIFIHALFNGTAILSSLSG
jgi:uncharacterized protein